MAGEGSHKISQSPRGYGQMDKIYGDGNVQPGFSPLSLNGGIHDTKPRQGTTSRHNTAHIETQVTTSTGDTDKVIYLYACILQDWPSLTPNKAEFLSKIIQFHEGVTNLRNTFKGHIFCQNTKVHVGRTFYISTNTLLLATPTLYQSFVLLATPTLYTGGARIFCNPKNIYTWVTRPPIYSEHSLISQYLAILRPHRDYFCI